MQLGGCQLTCLECTVLQSREATSDLTEQLTVVILLSFHLALCVWFCVRGFMIVCAWFYMCACLCGGGFVCMGFGGVCGVCGCVTVCAVSLSVWLCVYE